MKYQISEAQQALEVDSLFAGKFPEFDPIEWDIFCHAMGTPKGVANTTLAHCRIRLEPESDSRFCIKCPVRIENGLEMPPGVLYDNRLGFDRGAIHACAACGEQTARNLKIYCDECAIIKRKESLARHRDKQMAKRREDKFCKCGNKIGFTKRICSDCRRKAKIAHQKYVRDYQKELRSKQKLA